MFFLQIAFAHSQPSRIKVMNLPHSRPVWTNGKLRLKNGSWMLDSSWLSQWITHRCHGTCSRESFSIQQQFPEDWRPLCYLETQLQASGRIQQVCHTLHRSGNLTSISDRCGIRQVPCGSLIIICIHDTREELTPHFTRPISPYEQLQFRVHESDFYNSRHDEWSYLPRPLILCQETGSIRSSSNIPTIIKSVSEFLLQQWNTGQNAWVNSNKYDYSYDGSDMQLFILTTLEFHRLQWVQSTQSLHE